MSGCWRVKVPIPRVVPLQKIGERYIFVLGGTIRICTVLGIGVYIHVVLVVVVAQVIENIEVTALDQIDAQNSVIERRGVVPMLVAVSS
jgi:hypothetical protein